MLDPSPLPAWSMLTSTRVRHLQVIVGLMVAMYIVDTLVEYQLQYVAGHAYKGDRLTAFFGQFYGLYLNGLEAVF